MGRPIVRSRVVTVRVRPTPLEVVKRITRHNATDARLEGIDRHMQRWAQSQGSGVPEQAADIDHLVSKFKLTPLPAAEAVITDRIVLELLTPWRFFVHAWYRGDMPVHLIAEELGMERRRLYEERRIILAYLLGRLTAEGVRIASYRVR